MALVSTSEMAAVIIRMIVSALRTHTEHPKCAYSARLVEFHL